MISEISFVNNSVNTTFVYTIGVLITLFLFLSTLFLFLILVKNDQCNKNKIHQKCRKQEDFVETGTESNCSR